MNYIENTFVCLVAPLLVAVIFMKEKARREIFFLIIGMISCLLSSYISTFVASFQGADLLSASLEISPLVEEIMKFFPVMIFLLIFEPNARDAADCAVMTAIGFATFENVCFLMDNGASGLFILLIRGFSTGTAHVVCALFVAVGLYRLWDKEWLRAAGLLALLAVSVTFHGIFNILVSQDSAVAIIGYIIPLVTIILVTLGTKVMLHKTPN
jgi:RsiW-degrading membrane proteinase PrsW (M82 family)